MVQRNEQVDVDADLVALAMDELPYVTQAFQALAERYHSLLTGYCYNILRDHSEAEDTCQVILLKVYQGLPNFEKRSSFKTWMMKIATNSCYSRLQKMKRERERFVPLEQDVIENISDSGESNTQALAGDRFGNMIESLSDLEQQLLSLRFIAELGLDEIAEILGMRLSATKMRYYRALKKLDGHIDR